jgi:hydrogenase maturation protease
MDAKTCIVGYGNPRRGDDGVGPLVVRRLRSALGPRPWVRFFTLGQLEEGPLDEFCRASLLILVDACAEARAEEVEWRRVAPRLSPSPFTHHMDPGMFLWLMELTSGSSPETWLVSVRGEDFGPEEGISPGTMCRALRAQREIEVFLKERARSQALAHGASGRDPGPLVLDAENA